MPISQVNTALISLSSKTLNHAVMDCSENNSTVVKFSGRNPLQFCTCVMKIYTPRKYGHPGVPIFT